MSVQSSVLVSSRGQIGQVISTKLASSINLPNGFSGGTIVQMDLPTGVWILTGQVNFNTGIGANFSTGFAEFLIYNNNLNDQIQQHTLFSPLQDSIILEAQTSYCSVSVPIVCASTTTVSLRYAVEVDLSVGGSSATLVGGTGTSENELLAVCVG
jgi:hypothetical protein